MSRKLGLVVGGLVVALSAGASAQNQVKPRVLIMVDTSGSMTEHFTDNFSTGGDGSILYSDNVMTRQQSDGNAGMYVGFSLPANMCPGSNFDGVNSRLYAAKQAVTNVVNGSGDIDWGLMRYSGTVCANPGTGNASGGSNTACTSDDNCKVGEFCIGGHCHTDSNLCSNYGFGTTSCGSTCSAGYGATRKSGTTTCTNSFNNDVGNALTYAGDCGSTGTTAQCQTTQVCYQDSDCAGTAAGRCAPIGSGPVKQCLCGGTGQACPTGYTCSTTTPKHCIYNKTCNIDPLNTILVDPATANSTQVLQYVDGVEALPNNIAGIPVNPELRAVGGTPLAAAARTATQWYQNIVTANSDPQIKCRPYVLVQMTDGVDSCDSDVTNGPVAAASGFVAATVQGAKNPNKVYVVGLAFGPGNAGPLDQIAQVGGTGQARLANSQQDIEAALADIVASSVLVEKCNGIDDNCNGQCDENFPGVAVNATAPDGSTCSNPHSAAACDNGYPSASHCFVGGQYVCSSDQLSQVCSAPKCIGATGATLSCPAAGTMRVSNVTGLNAGMVGQVLVVNGSAQAADNGPFVITAVGAGTVDVANAGCVADPSTPVAYAVAPIQGATTAITMSGTTETITTSSTTGVSVGDTIAVAGAAPAADNGLFTVSAVTATTIVFTNSKAGTGTATTQGKWATNIAKCPAAEIMGVCNGIDDDCNGIIDDCTPGVANSCCTTCAPQQEVCNGKDDNCNGIIDDNTIDSGSTCSSNNVGDCAPSVWKCCSADPNVNGGACTQNASDKLYCAGGNPGYPVAGPDLCDGTDDNCNGTPNDGPPKICYTDASGNTVLTPAQDGVGACHHGLQQCTTVPLPAGDPGCPAGWPAGKVCPNPTHTYGTCQGTVGPQNETCNGIDDDCDGAVDDNLKDPWADPSNPQYPTAHPCCRTGNLADCMGAPGTSCHVGGYACVGGVKTCVGDQPKTAEICDMQDNDCNGVIDDLPGKDTVCTGPGINSTGTCYGTNVCVYPPDPTAGPQLQCRQKVGPSPEVCNGKDDNCNGLIDDTQPPLAPANGMLPGTGMVCDAPMPPNDKPPCKAGTTVCVAGMIVCQGAVGPMPNQCNGISTDCTGNPNTNGNCPTGFACYQGNCVAPCSAGEFPCPGGYACNMNTTACDSGGMHNGCCVPDACANITCPAGFNCQLDPQGMAQCVDPCTMVTCPQGYICKLGACVDGSCRTQGCPDGQICVATGNNMFACQPDACADVVCGANQFCQNGTCVNSCAGPCPTGQYCDKGQCVPDPCAHTPCVEGQVCQVDNGVGTCVENQCQFGCSIGQACCGGQCINDACQNLHCPEDTHCALTPDCSATCETNPASPKDQVVGAGGGGIGCAVGGSASESSSLAWLIVVAGVLLMRRRRAAEVRK